MGVSEGAGSGAHGAAPVSLEGHPTLQSVGCCDRGWWLCLLSLSVEVLALQVVRCHQITKYRELDKMTHRIVEIQLLALHRKLNKSHHVPWTIVQAFLGLCQAWCCDHFYCEPVLVLNHPLGEEPSPDIQPKPSVTPLWPFPWALSLVIGV